MIYLTGQRAQLIKLLLEYPDGLTNVFLNKNVGFRFGGRLHECRRDGFVFDEKRLNKSGSHWHYKLLHSPEFIFGPKPKATRSWIPPARAGQQGLLFDDRAIARTGG